MPKLVSVDFDPFDNAGGSNPELSPVYFDPFSDAAETTPEPKYKTDKAVIDDFNQFTRDNPSAEESIPNEPQLIPISQNPGPQQNIVPSDAGSIYSGLDEPSILDGQSLISRLENKLGPKVRDSFFNAINNAAASLPDQVATDVIKPETSVGKLALKNKKDFEKAQSKKGVLANVVAGAGERAGDLSGALLGTAKTLGEGLESNHPVGGFIWEDGDILPSYKTPEEWARTDVPNILAAGEKALKAIDFGYEERSNWESVKNEFSEGGALSGSAWGEVVSYAFEQGIKSTPDMVAVMFSLPAYVVARSGEIGEQRAINKGKEKAEAVDIMEAAPFAAASAVLERIGVRAMTSDVKAELGKEMIKSGISSAAKRVAKVGGGALTKEAATEAIQEGMIEYVGERFGTKAEMDFAEALDRAAGAAVAGGVFGAGVATTVATANEIKFDPKRELGKQLQKDIKESSPIVSDEKIAVDRLQPKTVTPIISKTPVDDIVFDEPVAEPEAVLETPQSKVEAFDEGAEPETTTGIADTTSKKYNEILADKKERLKLYKKNIASGMWSESSAGGIVRSLEKKIKYLEEKRNKSATSASIDIGEDGTPKTYSKAYFSGEFDSNEKYKSVKDRLISGSISESAALDALIVMSGYQGESVEIANDKKLAANDFIAKYRKREAEKIGSESPALSESKYRDSEQSVIDRIRKNASTSMANFDGKPIAPAMTDYVNKVIDKRSNLTNDESKVIANKHGLPLDVILMFEGNGGIGFGAIQEASIRGDKAESEFTLNRPKSTPQLKEKKLTSKERLKPDAQKDDLITMIRKLGGINTDIESDFKGRLKHLNNSGEFIFGIKGIEQSKANGNTLEDLAEKLHDMGFIKTRESSDLSELITKAETGIPVYSASKHDFSETIPEESPANNASEGDFEMDHFGQPMLFSKQPKKAKQPKPGIQMLSTKKIEVRLSHLEIAEKNIKKGRPSITPNDPVDVHYNETTKKYSLNDGYHRYLAVRGGSIDNALAQAKSGVFPPLLVDVKIFKDVDIGGFTKTEEVPNSLSSKAQKNKTELINDENYSAKASGFIENFATKGNPPRPETGNIYIGDRKVRLKGAGEIRSEGIRTQVAGIIGPRLYQSKIKGKNKEGHYSPRNSEIRIKRQDNVEVMAHEMAHYLDFHYNKKEGKKKIALRDFAKEYNKPEFAPEVKKLSYTTDKDLIEIEGFAEFVRLWLTQYNAVSQAAPKFTKKFEEVLSRDKKLNKKMRLLQDDMHRWYQQGDLSRVYASITGNRYTLKEKKTRILQQLPIEQWRQHYIDNIHAAKVITRTTQGGLKNAAEDPYKQLQLLNGIEAIVQQSFKNGAPAFNLVDGSIGFIGPSLDDVWGDAIKKGPKEIVRQEAYFASRRAKELKAQGREKKFTQSMIDAGLRLGEENPLYKKRFDQYQEYRKNMMGFYIESGYIDEESATAMMDANKDYVPFGRAMDNLDKQGQPAGGFKRLKGSERNINPILVQTAQQDAQHIYQALKARAMRQLYSDALKDQDGSLFISKLNPDTKPADKNTVKNVKADTVNRIAEVMAQSGQMIDADGRVVPMADGDVISIEDIDAAIKSMPGMLNFWTFGHKPKTTETMVDSFIDFNGKLTWVEINQENKILADMIDSMDMVAIPDGSLGFAVKMAMAVKRFQTLTITSAFQFAGPNIMRDQQQAFALSGGKFRPGIDAAIGLKALVQSLYKKDSVYKEMIAQGGPSGGRVRVQMDDNYGPEFVPNEISKPFYYPSQFLKNMLDTYISIMDSPEMATRLGFYIRMRDEVGPREAAWQAREISTDFKKHGTYAPWVLLQRTVPFLGAYTQSIDRDSRAYAEKDGEMKWGNLFKTDSGKLDYKDLKVRIFLASSLMASIPILLALLNDDEEKYIGLTEDQKTRFYHLFIGGEHYTIPKPHGLLSLAGTAGETMVDYIKGNVDGKEAQDVLLFAVAYHFAMDATPGLINPVIELMINKRFTGAPIISDRLSKVDDEYQYNSRTPLLYIRAGEALGVSPIAANHLVKGYTGYFSDYLTETTNAAMWDERAWGERPFKRDIVYMATKQFKPSEVPHRTKWTTGYYELKKKTEKIKNSLSSLKQNLVFNEKRMNRFYENKLNPVMANISKSLAKTDKNLSKLPKIIDAITYNKEFTAKEKEHKINAIYAAKNDYLKAAYLSAKNSIKSAENIISKMKR